MQRYWPVPVGRDRQQSRFRWLLSHRFKRNQFLAIYRQPPCIAAVRREVAARVLLPPSSSDDGRAVHLPDPCDHERMSPSRWLSGLRAWRVGATMIAWVVAGGVLVERRSRRTPSDIVRDFALIWPALAKVVFSRTLDRFEEA